MEALVRERSSADSRAKNKSSSCTVGGKPMLMILVVIFLIFWRGPKIRLSRKEKTNFLAQSVQFPLSNPLPVLVERKNDKENCQGTSLEWLGEACRINKK